MSNIFIPNILGSYALSILSTNRSDYFIINDCVKD